MYGLNALQTFKVNILLTIAVTAGGLIILSASASAQQTPKFNKQSNDDGSV